MRFLVAVVGCALVAACGGDDGSLSEDDALRVVRAAVDAATDAAGDPPLDDGEDVTLPEAAEAWVRCDGDRPNLADDLVRLEIGPDDILVAHAVAFDGDVADIVDAATPDCVADAWDEEVEAALDDVGFGGDVDLDAEGSDGEATVTGELLGFPIGFEGRIAAADGVDVVVVVLGGGSDVDGDAAGMVDDVRDAMLEAIEEEAG